MTVAHLLAAVAVGVGVGVIGWFVVPSGRRVPIWVPVAAALGAALLGTILAHVSDQDVTGVSVADLVMQVTFATLGVITVAATADKRRPDAEVTTARPGVDKTAARPGVEVTVDRARPAPDAEPARRNADRGAGLRR